MFQISVDLARAGVCSGLLTICTGITLDSCACRDRFQFYVAQDAHFLAAFSAAYEAAACKAAAQGQEKHAAVLRKLQDGIAEELRLHAAYAEVDSITWHAVTRPLMSVIS